MDRKGHGRSRSRLYCTAKTLESSREKLSVEPILMVIAPAGPPIRSCRPRRAALLKPLKNKGLRYTIRLPPGIKCKTNFTKIGSFPVYPRKSAAGAAAAPAPRGAEATVGAFRGRLGRQFPSPPATFPVHEVPEPARRRRNRAVKCSDSHDWGLLHI